MSPAINNLEAGNASLTTAELHVGNSVNGYEEALAKQYAHQAKMAQSEWIMRGSIRRGNKLSIKSLEGCWILYSPEYLIMLSRSRLRRGTYSDYTTGTLDIRVKSVFRLRDFQEADPSSRCYASLQLYGELCLDGRGTFHWAPPHLNLATGEGEEESMLMGEKGVLVPFFVTFLGLGRMKMRVLSRSLDKEHGDDEFLTIWAVHESVHN